MVSFKIFSFHVPVRSWGLKLNRFVRRSITYRLSKSRTLLVSLTLLAADDDQGFSKGRLVQVFILYYTVCDQDWIVNKRGVNAITAVRPTSS